MPLLKGKANLGQNIAEMEKAGHPRKQAIAAAYHASGVDAKDWAPEHLAYTSDMTREDWLGVMKFIAEEMQEPEHAPVRAGDKWMALAADRALGPFDSPELAVLARDRALGRYRFAVDFSTVRTVDQDGRLHVAKTPICMAAVNPYRGDEIPFSEDLGLDPTKIYMMLRPPDEIEKAAASSNNIQLMDEHVGVDAANPQKEYVAGTTGSDASFDGERLWNSLAIWDADSIKRVEDEKKRELSPSYRYDAVMEPGTWNGKKYDGKMTNIKFNHVALVEEGRQGADVTVMDGRPAPQLPGILERLRDQPPLLDRFWQ